VATASDNVSAECQVSSLFKEDLRAVGLAYSLDAYIGKPMVVTVGVGRRESRAHLAERIRTHYPDLHLDVCNKIAHAGSRSLKRVSNCVEAIKDNLITSSPEMIRSYSEMPEYKKLVHWAYSLAAHSADRVTREWKKFSALLKWLAVSSETPRPPIPRDFPGYGASWDNPSRLPNLWLALCPWLREVQDSGVMTKATATRLLHLCTSRNFPAGGASTRKASLEVHSRTLHSHSPADPIRRQIIERLSYLIGTQVSRFCQEGGYTSLGHTSLTSNASLDSTTDEGGRAAEVGMKFRAWLYSVPNQDQLKATWFGKSYWLKAGTPLWQTMCRSDLRHDPAHEAGESDDRVNLDFENFKLEDPLYGLDETTGFQLLQWSIEEGLRQGILAGKPYYSERENDILRMSGTAPSIRPSSIGEPGAKSRVVTVGEDWLTMLLQPWSHHVIGALRQHPAAKSGLTRGWQLFEWVKRQRSCCAPPRGDRYFLSSDLTTATDFCSHVYSLAMLEGLHRGIGRASDPYFALCAKLLCSGRVYESDVVKEFFDKVTSRGILMGDPGAKIVLTMHNLCAEMEAYLRYVHNMMDTPDGEFLYHLGKMKGPPIQHWRCFACSGDDHFGQGPREYLQRITLNHDLNGMSVSWPQNFLSPVGGFYCEEMLLTVGLRDDQIWKVALPLRDSKYEDQPHIDAMKVRLLSPCAKEHEGKDEPNPAIGKARQMHGMLAWLGGGWEVTLPIFSKRWEMRMEAYLPPALAFRFLPIRLGGIEAPSYHRSLTDVRGTLRLLPEQHLWAIKQVLDGSAPPLLSRTLATFATNARARGISSDAIEDEIRATLSQDWLVQGLDDAGLQLAAGYVGVDDEGRDRDLEWRNLRFKDKAAIAKRMRLTTVDEAINLIGRPYLFRDMLFPEISRRHGIDPYRSKQYENVSWGRRLEMFYANLASALPSERQPLTGAQEADTIERIARWCVENKPLDIPREVYYFPESVVVHEKLATLRTPL